MIAEPRPKRISGRIFQQLNDRMRFGIDQNRAVTAAPAQGKLVDPQNGWCGDGPLWQCPHHPQ